MNDFPSQCAFEAPIVSIIISCYNYARFMDETLSYVQRQNFAAWECVIVDDGSTDNTRAVGETWAKRDARFRYVHQPNGGVNSARNNGICNARGRWLRFLDADDLLVAFQIEEVLETSLEYSQADIVNGNFVFMAHDGSSFFQWSHMRSRLCSDDTYHDLLALWEKKLIFPPHAVLYRRECFERWGNWDETLASHEDWELPMRFAAHGARFVYHDKVVAAYRKHHGSMAGDATTMRQGFLKVMIKQLESPHVARRYKPLVVFRFLEDCLKAIVQKLQKRRIDLKAVYFDPDCRSPFRIWLLFLFALTFCFLSILKITDMLHVRWRRSQGDYKRINYPNFS